MFELKPLSRDGVAAALEKAVRYRVLNEPRQAESICRDVLEVDPENRDALVNLLLSLTDQFRHQIARADEAWEACSRLQSEYDKAYYSGIICERRAMAQFRQGHPGSGYKAYDGLRQAMEWYEKADALKTDGNDEAILRWNTCARTIMQNPNIQPEPEASPEPPLMLE